MKRLLKRIWNWIDDRSGISDLIAPLMKHKVPPGSKWSYVFGSATLFCFVLQILTGSCLALMYQATSDKAFQSLQFITNDATLGKILRGIHYFGASGMILLAGVHMIRVYITAAYKYPREMNWISGVVLLLLVTVMGFTGQLLRWDDNGVWSAVVGAEQMGRVPFIGKYLARLLIGGDTLGGQTLVRFYTYHVFMVPGLIILFLLFHLWLVMKNGISEPARHALPIDPATYRKKYEEALKAEGISFWPYAAWRDVIFGAAVIMVIIAAACIVGPPELRKAPDPSVVQTQPRPDWYLLWVYALFALMPREIESYAIFFGPLIIFFLLFAVPFISNKGERNPLKRPWAIAGSTAIVIFIITLLLVGYKAGWSPAFHDTDIPDNVLPARDATMLEGKNIFSKKGCLYCHRIKSYGGVVGPDLTHVGTRLSENELYLKILNGSKNMPSYAHLLSQEEMKELTSFLKNMK